MHKILFILLLTATHSYAEDQAGSKRSLDESLLKSARTLGNLENTISKLIDINCEENRSLTDAQTSKEELVNLVERASVQVKEQTPKDTHECVPEGWDIPTPVISDTKIKFGVEGTILDPAAPRVIERVLESLPPAGQKPDCEAIKKAITEAYAGVEPKSWDDYVILMHLKNKLSEFFSEPGKLMSLGIAAQMAGASVKVKGGAIYDGKVNLNKFKSKFKIGSVEENAIDFRNAIIGLTLSGVKEMDDSSKGGYEHLNLLEKKQLTELALKTSNRLGSLTMSDKKAKPGAIPALTDYSKTFAKKCDDKVSQIFMDGDGTKVSASGIDRKSSPTEADSSHRYHTIYCMHAYQLGATQKVGDEKSNNQPFFVPPTCNPPGMRATYCRTNSCKQDQEISLQECKSNKGTNCVFKSNQEYLACYKEKSSRKEDPCSEYAQSVSTSCGKLGRLSGVQIVASHMDRQNRESELMSLPKDETKGRKVLGFLGGPGGGGGFTIEKKHPTVRLNGEVVPGFESKYEEKAGEYGHSHVEIWKGNLMISFSDAFCRSDLDP